MDLYLIHAEDPAVPLLRLRKKTLRLSHIKISSATAATLPGVKKLRWNYSYYKKHRSFASTMILDKHHTLIDGYVTYLLARMLGIKKVQVYIRQ